jgi:protease I
MKKGIIFFSFLFLSLVSFSQTDEAGAKACLEDYTSGEALRVEKAFHPTATMKYVDYKTGEFKDVPIAEYIARVKANSSNNSNRPSRKIEIVSMNVEGTAAQAKIKIETDQVIMYDYMNLLKVAGEWKIVSKIFNRKDK